VPGGPGGAGGVGAAGAEGQVAIAPQTIPELGVEALSVSILPGLPEGKLGLYSLGELLGGETWPRRTRDAVRRVSDP
jgi:hypothetical protein